MRFALDMIWLSPTDEVVSVQPDVLPKSYPSAYCTLAQDVIELDAGRRASRGSSGPASWVGDAGKLTSQAPRRPPAACPRAMPKGGVAGPPGLSVYRGRLRTSSGWCPMGTMAR